MTDKSKPSDKNKETEHKLTLRNLRLADYKAIKGIMDTVYSNLGGSWTKEEFVALLKAFPEGQICISDKGKVIAGALQIS